LGDNVILAIRKKYIIILCVILLLIIAIIITVILVFSNRDNNAVRIERQWDIELPNGMKRIAHYENTNFNGEGARYEVFSFIGEPAEIEALFFSSDTLKKSIFQRAFDDELTKTGFAVDTDYLPDWKNDFRFLQREKFDRTLYLICFLNEKKLFALEIIL
jgi:hypothetical protein